MSSFVNDLIPLILDANNHWWPTDLVALSSVSSAWFYHSSRRLYPRPTLYSLNAALLLARSLSANPLLFSLVHSLSFKPTSTSLVQPQELKAIRFLLGLDRLTNLTFGGTMSIRAERFLKIISNQDCIRELHIDGSLISHSLSSRASLEWDDALASSFPNLHKLRLSHTELDINPPSYKFAAPFAFLILDNVDIVNGYLPHLLNGAPLEQLHVITKDSDVFTEEIRHVLASCTVSCLHYEVQKDNKEDSFVLDVNPATTASLRCLHLRGLFVDLGVLTKVNEMCKNLVEFEVSGRSVRVSSREWADFIKSGALSSLERIGLPVGTNSPPFVAWSPSAIRDIEEACAARRTPFSLQ